jgi:tol-pal system protein YbgF
MRDHRPRLTWTALPLVVLAGSGCFATRQDVQLLQNNLATMRAQAHDADSARREQLDRVIGQLGMVNDSLRLLSARTTKWQGDERGDLYAMGQQLIQIQALTGQSQAGLQKMRADLEARGQQLATPPVVPIGPTSGIPDTTHRTPTTPGPNQLFELALEQLRRGSTTAARVGFQDLLQKYPNADIAPDAQFYLADASAQEGNMAAADSGYQLVVARYPASPRAPTALYKHATTLAGSGKTQPARAAFEDVVRKYPQSDEAVLAKDRLRDLK